MEAGKWAQRTRAALEELANRPNECGYQYRCTICGRVSHAAMYPENDPSDVHCIHCGGKATRIEPNTLTIPIGWVRLVSKRPDSDPPIELVTYSRLSAIKAIWPHPLRHGWWIVYGEGLTIEISDAEVPGVLADIRAAQEELLQKGGRL